MRHLILIPNSIPIRRLGKGTVHLSAAADTEELEPRIDLSGCYWVTDVGIITVGHECGQLQSINL